MIKTTKSVIGEHQSRKGNREHSKFAFQHFRVTLDVECFLKLSIQSFRFLLVEQTFHSYTLGNVRDCPIAVLVVYHIDGKKHSKPFK